MAFAIMLQDHRQYHISSEQWKGTLVASVNAVSCLALDALVLNAATTSATAWYLLLHQRFRGAESDQKLYLSSML
jgi:hypothetical protein